METKELMLGDWVISTEFDKQVIDRVECVENNRVFLEKAKLYMPINYIKPILLTEEILEKNGFGYTETEQVLDNELTRYYLGENVYCANEDLVVGTYGDGVFSLGWLNNAISRLRYVHELQHFLRLYGIDKEIEL